jgi:hypothetical protein
MEAWAAGREATRRCVVGRRLQRARVRLSILPEGYIFGDLGAFGNGAPPQARCHLKPNIEMYPPQGTPSAPHYMFWALCNGLYDRHLHPMAQP